MIGGNVSYINEGYIILRIDELETRGILKFKIDGTPGDIYGYKLDPNDIDSNIIIQLNRQEKIYCNNAVQMFIIR